jgi:mono/diheme cytochrome c family protein
MKKTLTVAALLIAIIVSCRQIDRHRTLSSLLKTSSFAAQLFTVDITKDTVLVTRKGAIIRLPKGTLETSGNSLVQLEVKEAYTMQDIIAAGLTTSSNGQPLSSGGMIYLNATGENTVHIAKAITVSTPTPFIDPNMQLFKGEVQPDSTINWTDPAPLPPNPQQAGLEMGKQLFVNNCATCHKIDKDLTGPKLAHVVKRLDKYRGEEGRPYIDLYGFTRNNQAAIARSPYFCALYEKWHKTPMTSFPSLTDEELDVLYAYIENESDRLQLPIPDNGILQCLDSCYAYMEVAGRLEQLKRKLEQDSSDMVEVDRRKDTIIMPPGNADTIVLPIEVPDNLVDPKSEKSLYYQFTIEAFGWYNVDILLKKMEGTVESTLIVRMQGTYRKHFELYLVIPDLKVLTQAGLLKDKEDSYGFANDDGKINLPQGSKAWVFAVGEQDDQLLFAITPFTTSTQQELNLELAITTQEAFQKATKEMGIPDLKIQAATTQTGIELRKVIRELKSAEQLKPKNCNCNCVEPQAAPATISYNLGAVETPIITTADEAPHQKRIRE